jgi:glyoxylate reductase
VPDRPRIVVTRPISDEALKLLRPRADITVGPDEPPIPTPQEVVGLVKDADIVYTLPANPLTGDAIRGAKKLRFIATMGTGYDNIDMAAARERSIPVTYAPGILDETTADGVFALILAASRRLGEAERYLRAGKYRGWTPFLFTGRDVHHATLGIVGMGRIGEAVARRAEGFGMTVIHSSRSSGIRLDELLEQADFVSLHAPLTPDTAGLIGERELALMKPTAVLVNTARGGLVETAALERALRDGQIAAAGLDVTDPEPLPADHTLLGAPNLVVTPHIGSASRRTREAMADVAVDNLLAALAGDRMPHCANPEVYG